MSNIEGFKFTDVELNFIKKYQEDIDQLSSIHEILNFPFENLLAPGKSTFTAGGSKLSYGESQDIMTILLLKFGNMRDFRYLITEFRKEKKHEEWYGVWGQLQVYDSNIGKYCKVFDEQVPFIRGKVDLKGFTEQGLRDFLAKELTRYQKEYSSDWAGQDGTDFFRCMYNQRFLLIYFFKKGVGIEFDKNYRGV